MTGWLPEDAREWAGRPVARRVAEAGARKRAVLRAIVGRVSAQRGSFVRTACVSDADARNLTRGTFLDAVVDDGTGTIVVRWLGRDHVPGVHSGAEIEVEGTVSESNGRLVILNPLYRFVAPGRARGRTVVDDPADRAYREHSEGSGRSDQEESSTS